MHHTGGLRAFFLLHESRESAQKKSESSLQDAMDNDDNWLGRFSTLVHNHKNVRFT